MSQGLATHLRAGKRALRALRTGGCGEQGIGGIVGHRPSRVICVHAAGEVAVFAAEIGTACSGDVDVCRMRWEPVGSSM